MLSELRVSLDSMVHQININSDKPKKIFITTVKLLEKEMATHSSVLAWKIPGMGSHRVGHD